MLVPDEIRQCVGFIGYRDESGLPQLAGTAFFVGVELTEYGAPESAALFLVTARHVIDKVAAKGKQCVVRLNTEGGKAGWYDVQVDAFFSHPRHPADECVDIAVAPVNIPQGIQYKTIPTAMFINDQRAKENGMGLGDEVFVSGLFWNHHGKERNLPIIRVGNIAGMPEEPVSSRFGDVEAYLVEARSIGGLSGSPVFVHFGIARSFEGQVRFAQKTDYGVFYLLGVMQGHWESNGLIAADELPVDDSLKGERVNMGIAIVTPIEKVVQTLGRPELRAHCARVGEFVQKQRESELPVEDAPPDAAKK